MSDVIILKWFDKRKSRRTGVTHAQTQVLYPLPCDLSIVNHDRMPYRQYMVTPLWHQHRPTVWSADSHQPVVGTAFVVFDDRQRRTFQSGQQIVGGRSLG